LEAAIALLKNLQRLKIFTSIRWIKKGNAQGSPGAEFLISKTNSITQPPRNEPAAATANRPGPFGHDFLFFNMFFLIFFSQKRGKQTSETRDPRPYGQGLRFRFSSSAPGKRDKYS